MSIESGPQSEGQNKKEQIRHIELDVVPDVEEFVQKIESLPIEGQVSYINSFVKEKLKNAIAPNIGDLPEEEKAKVDESLDRSETRKMSEVLTLGYGVCVEYNALAKTIFDKLGIPCEFKSGQMGDGPKHTFLDIEINGTWEIFDPFAEVYLADVGRSELKRFDDAYYELSNSNI